jgi:hypothetical protein
MSVPWSQNPIKKLKREKLMAKRPRNTNEVGRKRENIEKVVLAQVSERHPLPEEGKK